MDSIAAKYEQLDLLSQLGMAALVYRMDLFAPRAIEKGFKKEDVPTLQYVVATHKQTIGMQSNNLTEKPKELTM